MKIKAAVVDKVNDPFVIKDDIVGCLLNTYPIIYSFVSSLCFTINAVDNL